jgi:hypothetical protein
MRRKAEAGYQDDQDMRDSSDEQAEEAISLALDDRAGDIEQDMNCDINESMDLFTQGQAEDIDHEAAHDNGNTCDGVQAEGMPDFVLGLEPHKGTVYAAMTSLRARISTSGKYKISYGSYVSGAEEQ